MTITYDFKTVTETRTDPEGNQFQTEVRGPLQVWFYDSDPATDSPDQTYDWRSKGDEPEFGAGPPDIVRTQATAAEIPDPANAAQGGYTPRQIRIIADAALGRIERRNTG